LIGANSTAQLVATKFLRRKKQQAAAGRRYCGISNFNKNNQ
jgi:hypothetical protein